MLEIKRKKGESFESMLRRFSRRVQESGRILTVKKIRYHAEKPNKTQIRDSALRRKEKREHREYMVKSGKLREDMERMDRRRA